MIQRTSGWQALRAVIIAWALVAMVFAGFPPIATAQSQREYIQTIYLSGFKCISIQRDSIVNPDNEVFFVVVANAPESSGVQGRSTGTFKGVKAGFGRKTRNSVWSGRQQPLSLRVVMFERDAGGESGMTAAQVVTKAVGAYATRNSGSRPKSASLDQDESAEPQILRAAKRRLGNGINRAFGLSHDSMGYDRQTFGRGDWSSRPTYNERDIRYHFSTTHRANGANCRGYFLIERGMEVKQDKPAPPPPGQRTSQRPVEQPNQPYQDDGYGNPNGGYGPGYPPDPYQPGPYDGGPNDPPPLPPIFEPPPPPPPPPPEPDWFRARFKNTCDVPISLSYAYKNPSRGWVKRGWANFDPGETGVMEGNTLTPEIYIYSSRGRVSGSFDPEVIQLSVRSNGFDEDRSTNFNGDKDARTVPFSLHVLRDVSGTQTVSIMDCDAWIAGKILTAKELARNAQIKQFSDRQAQLALDRSLNEAAFAGDAKGIRKALDKGAYIESRSARLSLAGSTPLHLAMQSFDEDAINLLLDKGADPTKLTSNGSTVFHSAVSANKPSLFFEKFPAKTFQRLADAGVDFDKKDNRRRTAFGELARILPPEFLRQKIAGSRNDLQEDGDFLSFLASRTTVDLERTYERRGSIHHHTALHTAAFSGHQPLAKALLANGANPLARDSAGKIPRERASEWPADFQELFGPLPQPEPDTVAPPAADPTPAVPQQMADPAELAERCRQLVARKMIKAEDCEAPN